MRTRHYVTLRVVLLGVFVVLISGVGGSPGAKAGPGDSAANAGWREFWPGSASGGGISNTGNPSVDPSIALDNEGQPVITWYEHVGNDWEIYVRRWSGQSWVEIGNGSASGSGISNDNGDSESAQLAVAPGGSIIVVWTNYTEDSSAIFARRWNGSSWSEMGNGSASGRGISNTDSNASMWPSLAIDSDGMPIVAWSEYFDGSWEIYLRRWNGSSWTEMGTGSASGGGISNNGGFSVYPSLAISPDGEPIIAWNDNSGGNHEIFVRRWNGSSWVELGSGSAFGGGISNDGTQSTNPSLAIAPNGTPIVAWHDFDYGEEWEIFARRWDGASWVEMGDSASSGGISQNTWTSVDPSLAISPGGTPVVAWMDFTDWDYEVYLRRWDGSAWVEMDSGSASGGGVSDNSNSSYPPSLVIDPNGRAILAWDDLSNGNDEIFVRTYEAVPTATQYAFVPIGIHQPPTCFLGPQEEEPNNNAGAANGPLCSAGTVFGLPNDDQDYFSFDTSSHGNIVVTVNNHQGEGVQLQLYYGSVSSEPIDLDLDQKDGLRVSAPNGRPGRYYILIYTETPNPGETHRYTLQTSFPQ